MALQFAKYQGLGNDFILLDNRCQDEPLVTPVVAKAMCDRHFGIGADGVIFVLPGHDGSDYAMRIYNCDGSEPEMCGNGIRCFARYVAALEGETSTERSYRVWTLGGIMTPKLTANGDVSVDMGIPQLLAYDIPTTLRSPQEKVIEVPLEIGDKTWSVTCVATGNPHCLIFVDDVAAITLSELGPQFEHHTVFPQRTNTEFIEVVRRDYLKMRVWERGAGATLACGTGACATVVAGVLTGRSDRLCQVELPGGCLQIEWSELDQHLSMTGPAELVFTGVSEWESVKSFNKRRGQSKRYE